ncbi:MAG: copper chaperone PCu(A)C [Magnetovibrio sp.]|nr:copper chaperone PCu(A)C [Magnetovibrio sp.]
MNSIKTFITTTVIATTAIVSSALAGDITVSGPWARGSAGMAKAGAAFMQIQNSTGMDDTLVAVKANVSKKVELHTHLMEGGVMKMREVKGGIPLPAGKTQELKPGSYHVMFMGLNEPFKEGSMFPITMVFKNAGEQTINVHVKSPKAMGAMKSMDHSNMNMNHGDMKATDQKMGGMKK